MRESRFLLLPVLFILLSAPVMSAQPGYYVEGLWRCSVDYEGHNYEFRFEAKNWNAYHTLINTDDKESEVSLRRTLTGTIEVSIELNSYVMRLSGALGIKDWKGDFGGTAPIKKGNDFNMKWAINGTLKSGKKVAWTEDCFNERGPDIKTNPTPSSTPVPTAERIQTNPYKISTPTATVTRREQPAQPDATPRPTPSRTEPADPGELISKQIEQSARQEDSCGKKVVATMFGYFSYKANIDLTTGVKQIWLDFEPYIIPSAGLTEGQAIDLYAAQAQLAVKPALNIPHIKNESPNQLKQYLGSHPVRWTWNVDSSFWSSTSETNGLIVLTISSATGKDFDVPLPVTVKLNPWWWPFRWIWENILGKPEVSLVLLVFLVTAWRKGMAEALRWIWMHIKHKAA